MNKIEVEQMNVYMDKLYNVVSAPVTNKNIDNIIDFVEEQKKNTVIFVGQTEIEKDYEIILKEEKFDIYEEIDPNYELLEEIHLYIKDKTEYDGIYILLQSIEKYKLVIEDKFWSLL